EVLAGVAEETGKVHRGMLSGLWKHFKDPVGSGIRETLQERELRNSLEKQYGGGLRGRAIALNKMFNPAQHLVDSLQREREAYVRGNYREAGQQSVHAIRAVGGIALFALGGVGAAEFLEVRAATVTEVAAAESLEVRAAAGRAPLPIPSDTHILQH